MLVWLYLSKESTFRSLAPSQNATSQVVRSTIVNETNRLLNETVANLPCLILNGGSLTDLLACIFSGILI